MKQEFRKLAGSSFRAKLQYIWDYYKLHLILILVAVLIFISVLHQKLTTKKPFLYIGAVNVVAGEELTHALTNGFIETSSYSPDKYEIIYYSGLYLTENSSDPDYRYAYASEMKILASIEAKKLDIVFCDQKAYEAFRSNDYLLDLDTLFSAEESSNPIFPEKISDSHFFIEAGFKEDVYVGVIKNTPRLETTKEYLRYLWND